MDPKNVSEPAPVIPPVTKQLIRGKYGVRVSRFSKTTGRNCGPMEKGEERDHSKYEYSDEM